MGGCCSIAVNIAMFVYIIINLKKLVLKEDDNITTTKGIMDYTKLDPINYEDTDLMIF